CAGFSDSLAAFVSGFVGKAIHGLTRGALYSQYCSRNGSNDRMWTVGGSRGKLGFPDHDLTAWARSPIFQSFAPRPAGHWKTFSALRGSSSIRPVKPTIHRGASRGGGTPQGRLDSLG